MADEKEEQTCSCTGWKVSFAICFVCSVIMLILCIVLFVKRNVIHDTVYDKIDKHIQNIKDRRARKSEYGSTPAESATTTDDNYEF